MLVSFSTDTCSFCPNPHKDEIHDEMPQKTGRQHGLVDMPLSQVKLEHGSRVMNSAALRLILQDPAIALTSPGPAPEKWQCLLSDCEDGETPPYGEGFVGCTRHMALLSHKEALEALGKVEKANLLKPILKVFQTKKENDAKRRRT
jgi:hypothetical protein